PKIQQMVKEYFNGKKVNFNTNPDELVAFGAAAHDAVINEQAGDTVEKIFQDITVTADEGRSSQEEISTMLKSVTQFAAGAQKLGNTIEARNKLESAVYHLKNELDDENKLAGHVSEADKETLTKACNDVILWMKENTDAELAHYKHQQVAFDSITQPILDNFCQQAHCGANDAVHYITDH
ncbi:hypothetical protein RFI_03445, partial [Reticulomyxa filosa]